MERPETLGVRVNYVWISFSAVVGVLNPWIAFNFSTDSWVSFKLFGGRGLMIVFTVLQGVVVARYLPEEQELPPPQAGTPPEKP